MRLVSHRKEFIVWGAGVCVLVAKNELGVGEEDAGRVICSFEAARIVCG